VGSKGIFKGESSPVGEELSSLKREKISTAQTLFKMEVYWRKKTYRPHTRKRKDHLILTRMSGGKSDSSGTFCQDSEKSVFFCRLPAKRMFHL
jgi:hypothetical protein